MADQSDGQVIKDFLADYEGSGYLAYASLTERARSILREELSSVGIKHELFDRGCLEGLEGGKAKIPTSARRSILRRQEDRKIPYQSRKEIEDDMHDLAGIRVALYYPGDYAKAAQLIEKRFEPAKDICDWPDPNPGRPPYSYPDRDPSAQAKKPRRCKKFPGYIARHYRVRLKATDISSDVALKGKVIEIQLMSLLMHTWAKINHELMYKPRGGCPEIDVDGEALVDVLNGLIVASEQLLRHIQINRRTTTRKSRRVVFRSKYCHEGIQYSPRYQCGLDTPEKQAPRAGSS
ncbi:hypothetical protein B0T25DRAFT_586315 [Lasiosphaeria hispida]|uniref:RelA/SpoT domain-containing protein n=1 Tax=Lasiosphaeria hispida TaxID=260671 RepID=A0AAJ0M7R2_9PEZI|nr:hypothetical protein B0T25DRAFT_586315 [Lasiosphaeria hispida]